MLFFTRPWPREETGSPKVDVLALAEVSLGPGDHAQASGACCGDWPSSRTPAHVGWTAGSRVHGLVVAMGFAQQLGDVADAKVAGLIGSRSYSIRFHRYEGENSRPCGMLNGSVHLR